MAERNQSQTYSTRVSGFWNTSHELRDPEGVVGTLSFRRNALGLVVSGTYVPTKGETLILRRDPVRALAAEAAVLPPAPPAVSADAP